MTTYTNPRCFTRILSMAARAAAAFARLRSPLRLPGSASWCNPLWAAAVLILLAIPAPATSITALAGSLAKQDVTEPGAPMLWINKIPNALPAITWFAGANTVDGVSNPAFPQILGETDYFGPGPKGQQADVLEVFGDVLGDPRYSTVTNSGTMKSTVETFSTAGGTTEYYVDWSATATGTTGTNKGAFWRAQTVANDPWDLDASDFANAPGSTFNLFFMAGLTGADLSSPNASLDFDVSYQTGAGTQDLLDVTVDRSGVHATEGTIAGLEIYRLASATDGPLDVTGSPLTASQIQALLQGLSSSGQLTSSVLFGFELSGQPIPTQDLGGGVVAWMNVDGAVTDSAVAPEPASLSLFAAGSILIAAGRLRKRKRAR